MPECELVLSGPMGLDRVAENVSDALRRMGHEVSRWDLLALVTEFGSPRA